MVNVTMLSMTNDAGPWWSNTSLSAARSSGCRDAGVDLEISLGLLQEVANIAGSGDLLMSSLGPAAQDLFTSPLWKKSEEHDCDD